MADKQWPEYGCHVDLSQGEEPDDCVINFGAWSDCLYGRTPSGLDRKSPHTCKYWKKIKRCGTCGQSVRSHG